MAALPRYCFEQVLTTVTHRYINSDELTEYDESTGLGNWAIYDRRHGLLEPIAHTESADVAQRIVDALNI